MILWLQYHIVTLSHDTVPKAVMDTLCPFYSHSFFFFLVQNDRILHLATFSKAYKKGSDCADFETLLSCLDPLCQVGKKLKKMDASTKMFPFRPVFGSAFACGLFYILVSVSIKMTTAPGKVLLQFEPSFRLFACQPAAVAFCNAD